MIRLHEAIDVARPLGTSDSIHALDEVGKNAGILLNRRTTTREGNETSLATNLLAPFLLTQLLLPHLEESSPSMIINLSSGGMSSTGADVDDLQYEKKPWKRRAVRR
jgi:NAD(P)-dependent dehydrogenase (short-subunit alcohol dehydrogenase family)